MPLNLRPNSDGEPEKESVGFAENRFREASSILAKKDSMEAKMDKVRSAVSKIFSDPGPSTDGPYSSSPSYRYAYMERMFKDVVVYRKGEKLYRVDYKCDREGNVEFGEPELAEDAYVKGKVKKEDIDYEESRFQEKAKLGTGARFASLKKKLSGKVSNPAAVAASVGRKKYGNKRFAKLSAKGRKDAAKVSEAAEMMKKKQMKKKMIMKKPRFIVSQGHSGFIGSNTGSS